MDSTITKLPLTGSNGALKYIYVMLTWTNNTNIVFEINILDHINSWSGRMSTAFAETFCKDVESIEEYCSNIRTCLTTVSDSCIYEFYEVGNNVAKLTWKRQFEDVTQEYGSVLVYRDEVPLSKDILIDKLLNNNEDLTQRVAEISTTIDSLRYNLKCNQDELLRFVDAKTALEASLYEKFIHLLNAKKRRIQLLEESVVDLNPHNLHDFDL